MSNRTARDRRYNTSPKGRARNRRYDSSEKGRARDRRWFQKKYDTDWRWRIETNMKKAAAKRAARRALRGAVPASPVPPELAAVFASVKKSIWQRWRVSKQS